MFSGWREKIKNRAGENTGSLGEEIAVSFLKKSGYAIIERNYRKRYGEIDIIAEDGGELVFIEVKTRKSSSFGSPFEAVDSRKQEKMSRVAMAYMISRSLTEQAARFDVVAVRLEAKQQPKVELVKDAFELCGW
ncbi:MAG: YraN family protein [Desulfobulbaceae bacterium]|nr:YraN family protein [Desulfobulbaceae bacterium]